MLKANKAMRVMAEGRMENVVTREVQSIGNGTLIVVFHDDPRTGEVFEKSAYCKEEAGVTLRDADGRCIYVTPDYVVGVITD
jgi:hypothetical protein